MMRAIDIDSLKPGDVIARDLYTEQGQVLLGEGVRLTEEYIRSLRERGYTRLYVSDEERPVHVHVEEVLTEETRLRAVQALNESFENIGTEVRRARVSSLADVQRICRSETVRSLVSEEGPLAGVHKIVDRILHEVLTRSTLAGLRVVRSEDIMLYDHSVEVCVLGVMIGHTIDLPTPRMRQLATGCLLHDIGAVFLHPDLRETLRLQQHTELGYELLRSSKEADILAPHVAYEHHEHQDGTGMPRGLVGSNRIQRERVSDKPVPTLIGEIAAVANAYSNLVHGTRYQPPLQPDLAIQAIRAGAGTFFNYELVLAFLSVVPIYPMGTEVVIAQGDFKNYTGVVVSVPPDALDRPLVSLIKDNRGEPIEPIEIDLCTDTRIRLRSKGL